MVWVLLALIGASALVIALAIGTGASAFMASIVGPGWWLLPIAMIVVMTLVMSPMMSHGRMESDHHEMPEDSAAIAARRYAAGEISREEYLRIKADIEAEGDRGRM